jgi:hypothetical protein
VGIVYSEEFSTYTNNSNGIQINYPKDWVYKEGDNSVTFVPVNEIKLQESNPMVSLFIQKVTKFLPYQNIPLDLFFQYFNNTILRGLVLHGANITNVEKIEFNEGLKAFKIELSSNVNQTRELVFLSTKTPDSYLIVYLAHEKYDVYLPIIQTMISSLRFGLQ